MYARSAISADTCAEAVCALVVGARLPMGLISPMHLFKMFLLPAPQVFFVLLSVHGL